MRNRFLLHTGIFVFASAWLFASPYFDYTGSSWTIHASRNAHAATYNDTDVPVVLPRSTWENDESLERLLDWIPERTTKSKSRAADDQGGDEVDDDDAVKVPDYFPISRIILHDQGCADPDICNDDSRDPIEQIQAIYRFHAATRGWGDIGYHFIIDRQGNIYEGRFGGFEVRGAHLYADRTCQNFNLGSIGILLLGDYQHAPVPQAMEESVAQLSAWLLAGTDIDPGDLAHKSDIWTNGKDGTKSNGFPRCDLTEGDFSTSFNGPVLLTHKEIENGNSDVQNIDLDDIRERASDLYDDFRRLVFKDDRASRYYALSDGAIASVARPTSNKNLVEISSTQLNYFPPKEISLYANGSLLRAVGTKDVFLIDNKKRRHITSAALFERLELDWRGIQEVNREEILAHKLGSPLLLPEGTLIGGMVTGRVYYVGDDGRYWIAHEDFWDLYDFDRESIVRLTENEISRYRNRGILPYPTGTVVKESTQPQVYVVQDQSLHWIKTAELFEQLGFDVDDIVSLARGEFRGYDIGKSVETIDEHQNLLASAKNIITATIDEIKQVLPEIEIEPTIRIAICWTRDKNNCAIPVGQTITVKSDGAYQVSEDGGITLRKAGIEETFEYAQNRTVRIIPQEGAGTVQVVNYNDRPAWNPSINDNVFRGVIELHYGQNEAYIINELPLEDYLRGIAEVVNADDDEYKKVLITAARTYAYGYLTDQDEPRHAGKPFTLMNLATDQLYRGFVYEQRSQGVAEAVEDTKGKIITYNGTPIVAAYSSDSGGVTNSACSVFSGRYCESGFEYLRGGIKDPANTEHVQSKIAASHGVGISTQGARALIETGSSYDEVIEYYYPGVAIEQID